MQHDAPHVLVIDDDRAFRRLAGALLRRHGITVSELAQWTGQTVTGVDAVLLDNSLGQDREGVELLPEISSNTGEVPVILITAQNDVELAVRAMRAGAFDFLSKPITEARLVSIVRHAMQHRELVQRVRELETASRKDESFEGIIGVSPHMREIFRAIESVASTDAPVFITGESGTGKELVARAIHTLSGRTDKPIIPLNVSAISKDLVVSTLFGHERGAFTGADERRLGACEQASGGTLLLDELAEMPVETQPKLLRFLQDGTFRRVGGWEELDADVRVISATNRDPQEEIRRGTLRADLFYRLNVVPIRIAPLRERPEDIEPLCRHFLGELREKYGRAFSAITPPALERLRRARWPGNVRELRHLLERLVVMSDADELTADLLPPESEANPQILFHAPREQPIPTPRDHEPASGVIVPMAELERRAILDAIAQLGGSPGRAAKALGISEATVYRKLRRYREDGTEI